MKYVRFQTRFIGAQMRCSSMCFRTNMKVKPLIKDSDTEDSRSKIMTELSIRNLSATGRQHYLSGEECNDNQFSTVISALRLDVSATCIIFTFDYKTRLKFLQLILLFLWLSFATNTCDRGFAISEMLIDLVRIAKTTCGFYKNTYWTGLALSKFYNVLNIFLVFYSKLYQK